VLERALAVTLLRVHLESHPRVGAISPMSCMIA
jgi:hypothetical protein